MKRSDARRLVHVLHWAQQSNEDPSMATADWLARDIDPKVPSAIALLTNRQASLEYLRQAKDVYKTMRLIGETAADRRMGGRLYLAAIAAAIVVHDTFISRQSTATLSRGLLSMTQDRNVSPALRELASEAMDKIAARYSPGTEHTTNAPDHPHLHAHHARDSERPAQNSDSS